MVEIREEESTRHDGPTQSTPTYSNETNTTRSSPSNIPLSSFLAAYRTDVVLCLFRMVTVFSSLYYVMPYGLRSTHQSAYSKAFIAATVSNGIRLYHRVGPIRFSREFFWSMLAEDSCHYLIYCALFIATTPVTMALMPILLFALMHAADFAVKMSFATGLMIVVAQKVSHLLRDHLQNLLGIIALSEIFLMPMLIVMVFAAKVSIFLPFLYFRFLTLRYMSRRNDATRKVFYALRLSLEQAVANNSCPQILRHLVYSAVSFISRLCPTTT